jgi:acetyl-CoA carboxylase biotin carboxyl carrier protein
MSLTEDEVIQIFKFIEDSNFDEFNLTMGDLKLVVRKRSGSSPINEEHVVKPPAESIMIEEPAMETEKRNSEIKRQKIEEKATEPGGEGFITIKSPMLGTFYRRPDPSSPPYVEVGSLVEENDTVCLIEVMKVFNAVKAEVKGYIDKIFPESGQLIEYGQPLFLVRPYKQIEKRK